jgi:WD40 repeat protein
LTARLWKVSTGKEITALRGHNKVMSFVAFSPDGKLLATGSADLTARLWEVAMQHVDAEDPLGLAPAPIPRLGILLDEAGGPTNPTFPHTPFTCGVDLAPTPPVATPLSRRDELLTDLSTGVMY